MDGLLPVLLVALSMAIWAAFETYIDQAHRWMVTAIRAIKQARMGPPPMVIVTHAHKGIETLRSETSVTKREFFTEEPDRLNEHITETLARHIGRQVMKHAHVEVYSVPGMVGDEGDLLRIRCEIDALPRKYAPGKTGPINYQYLYEFYNSLERPYRGIPINELLTKYHHFNIKP